MDHFAVAGHPVLHSRSPQIFNAAFRALGHPGRYIRLAAETAEDALVKFRRLGLAGLNVTTPFKAAIPGLVDELDEASALIGAANVVHRRGNALCGANTDHLGVSGALAEEGFDPGGRRCLVAGAGGAGRAAVYALRRGGGDVAVFDPDTERAAQAARDFGITAVPVEEWKSRFENSEIIVSAAPGGCVAIGDARIRPGQVLLEADYRHPGLRDVAAARGLRYISGGAWLKHQALPALDLFLGAGRPAPEIDWRECLEGAAPAGRGVIALIGFMGSGKSAAGRSLAQRLDWGFADTDEWIEKSEGMTVAEIFDGRGEAFFRSREKEAVARLAAGRRLVVSCGGGAILDPDNRAVLASAALTVWLDVSMETAVERLGGADRPLLRGGNRVERAARLFAARRDEYFAAADLVVSNDGRPEMAVGRILEEVRSSV
jgi:shikimate dehydrogenase